MINLKHISKTIGDKVIFDDLSLNINQGDYVAITGPSGCGKTTLLNILGLIEGDFKGEYFFDRMGNIKVNTRRSQKIIRNKISYLFQNFALIEEETVRYNLMLALKYVKVSKKKKLVQINEVLTKLELSHVLNQKVAELSGGEQQRIALARVILKPSELILADEPTGSLDSDNRDKVLDIIESLNHMGKTVVIVTHDKVVAERCRRIIRIG